MDTETKNGIEALLDDATDGVEQAREALQAAVKKAREAGREDLAIFLGLQHHALGEVSNRIGAAVVGG